MKKDFMGQLSRLDDDEVDQHSLPLFLVIGYIEMIYDEINEINSELFGSLIDDDFSDGGEYDLSRRLEQLYDDIRNIKYSICH